jgi:fibronectin-binding autotransporter adhesin
LSIRQILAYLLAVHIALYPVLSPAIAWAQGKAPTNSSVGNAAKSPLNLNLSSTTPTLKAPVGSPVTILVGGTRMQVNGSTLLTPSEYLAVTQILTSGRQSLQLSASGNADSGSVSLSGITQPLSSLTVPQGVTAVENFGLTNGRLSLSGDLTNSGQIIGLSTSSQVNAGTISATNISNLAGGLIEARGIDLTLQASQTLLNAGTISASGNLNLSAPSVVNSGQITAAGTSLTTTTSNLTNSGTMQAINGSLTISSLNQQGLTINNSLGSLIAQNDLLIQLNPNLAAIAGSQTPLTVTGGLLAGGTSIGFQAPNGSLAVNVDQTHGPVDITASTASITVSEGDKFGLDIRTFNVSGDPDITYNGTGSYTFGPSTLNTDGGFVNINSTEGSITFTGDIVTTPTASGAGGNVTLNAATTISTQNITTSANGTGNAGNISITAPGAISTSNLTANGGTNSTTGNITINGGSTVLVNGSITGNGQALIGNPKTLTIIAPGTIQTTGQITYGGNVILNSTAGSISTAGVDTSQAGGDVVMVANAGNITVNTTGINTGSASMGQSSGTVELVAPSGAISVTGPIPATLPSGSLTTAISTAGSNGAGSGDVNISAGSFTTNGDIDTSNYTAASVGNGVGSAGNINIFSAGNITAQNLLANSSSAAVGNGGTILLSAGNGTAAAGSAVGNINVQNISATASGPGTSGGNLFLITPGTITAGNINLSTTGNFAGGSVTIQAGNQNASGSLAPAQSGTLTLGSINTSGSSVGGSVVIANLGANGGITVNGGITTDATGVNGQAGSLAMVAPGAISVTGNVSLQATNAGNTNGAAGDVFISSGVSSGTAISIPSVNVSATTGSGNESGFVYLITANSAAGNGITAPTITGAAAAPFLGLPTSEPAGGGFNSGNPVISISPTAVNNWSPGGFNAINVQSLFVSTTNDPRLIVPIVLVNGNASFSNGLSGGSSTVSPPIYLLSAGNITTAFAGDENNSVSQLTLISSAGSISSSQQLKASGNVNIIASQGFQANGGGCGGFSQGSSIFIATPSGGITLGSSTGGSTTVNATGGPGGSITIISAGTVNDFNDSFNLNSATTGSIKINVLNGSLNLSGNTNFTLDGVANNTLDLRATFGIETCFGCTAGSGSTISFNGSEQTANFVSYLGNIDNSGFSSISNGFGAVAGLFLTGYAPNGLYTSGTVNNIFSEGSMFISAKQFLLPSGDSIHFGFDGGDLSGVVSINTSGSVQLGSPGNFTGSSIQEEPVLSAGENGGSILINAGTNFIDYETTLNASGTFLGGTIAITAGGSITLFQGFNSAGVSFPASLIATGFPTFGTATTGGRIILSAAGDVASLLDTGSGTATGVIASGVSSGGDGGLTSITSSGGNINLTTLSQVSPVSNGDLIIAAFGNTPGSGNITSTVPIGGLGGDAGTRISIVAAGNINVAGVSAQGIASGANSGGFGGSIFISAGGNITTGQLNASGLTDGSIIVTTAQPAAGATGSALTTSATPSGTINVAGITLTTGFAGFFTSGFTAANTGVTIGTPPATTPTITPTIDFTTSVLPLNTSITANTTIGPASMPGGGFQTFSNTATISFANPSTAFAQPLSTQFDNPIIVQSAQTTNLGTINTAGHEQGIQVVTPGAISFTSITDTGTGSSSLTGTNGVALSVLLLSTATSGNAITGTGNITTTSSGTAPIWADVLAIAPLGAFNTSGSVVTTGGSGVSQRAGNVIIIAGEGINFSSASSTINTEPGSGGNTPGLITLIAPSAPISIPTAPVADNPFTNNTPSTGSGGNIIIQAGSFSTTTGVINTSSDSGQQPGEVNIEAIAFINIPGGINTSATGGAQAPGTVYLTAEAPFLGSVFVGGITAQASAQSNSNGGGVFIAAQSSVTINGSINGTTASTTGNAAPEVAVTAGNAIDITGSVTNSSTSITVGEIQLIAGNQSFTVGGSINSSTTAGPLSAGSAIESVSGSLSLILPANGLTNIGFAQPGGSIQNSINSGTFAPETEIQFNGGTFNLSGQIITSSNTIGGDVVISTNAPGAINLNTSGMAARAIDLRALGTDGITGGSFMLSTNFSTNGNIPVGVSFTANGTIDTSAAATSSPGTIVRAGSVNINAGSISVSGITTTNSAGDGGDITLVSAGTMSVGTINASGGSTGSGGQILLANSELISSGITATSITSTGVGTGKMGGSLVVMAADGISVSGAINLSGTSGAAGGNLLLLSGGFPGAAGAINTGAISTSGDAGGGDVIVTSFGSGNIALSTINTQVTGTSGLGGAVTITGGGVISTGNIQTGITGTVTNSFAGSVILTTSSTASQSIVVGSGGDGTIDTSVTTGNQPGQVFLISESSSSQIAFSSVTQNVNGVAGNALPFVGPPTSAGTLSNGSVISFVAPTTSSAGSVQGFSAGSFASINVSGTVTVNANGIPQLIIPIVAASGTASIGTIVSQGAGAGTASSFALLAPGNVQVTNAINANSTSGPGATVVLASPENSAFAVNNLSLPSINVSSTGTAAGAGPGGTVIVAVQNIFFNLTSGSSINASSTNGYGGSVFLLNAGGIQGSISLGSTTDNVPAGGSTAQQNGFSINASGVNGGNIIAIAGNFITDNEVALISQGTAGNGGTVKLSVTDLSNGIQIFNSFNSAVQFPFSNGSPAIVNVSGTANGGNLTMLGGDTIQFVQDTGSLNNGTGTSQASLLGTGGVSGGTLNMTIALQCCGGLELQDIATINFAGANSATDNSVVDIFSVNNILLNGTIAANTVNVRGPANISQSPTALIVANNVNLDAISGAIGQPGSPIVTQNLTPGQALNLSTQAASSVDVSFQSNNAPVNLVQDINNFPEFTLTSNNIVNVTGPIFSPFSVTIQTVSNPAATNLGPAGAHTPNIVVNSTINNNNNGGEVILTTADQGVVFNNSSAVINGSSVIITAFNYASQTATPGTINGGNLVVIQPNQNEPIVITGSGGVGTPPPCNMCLTNTELNNITTNFGGTIQIGSTTVGGTLTTFGNISIPSTANTTLALFNAGDVSNQFNGTVNTLNLGNFSVDMQSQTGNVNSGSITTPGTVTLTAVTGTVNLTGAITRASSTSGRPTSITATAGTAVINTADNLLEASHSISVITPQFVNPTGATLETTATGSSIVVTNSAAAPFNGSGTTLAVSNSGTLSTKDLTISNQGTGTGSSTGNIQITDPSNTGTLSSPSIQIATTNGSVTGMQNSVVGTLGGSTDPNVGTFQFQTTGSGVALTTGTITAPISTTLTSAGTLNTTGTISSNNVNLTSTSNTINNTGTVSGTGANGTVTITSQTELTDASLTGVSAPNLIAQSTGANILLNNAYTTAFGTSVSLIGATGVAVNNTFNTATLTASGGTGTVLIQNTNAPTISATSAGNVTINDSTPVVQLNASSSTNGTLQVTSTGASGTLTLGGAVSGSNVTLISNNGSVSLTNSVTATGSAPNGVVSIQAATNITDSGLTNVSGQALSLTSTAGSVTLGNSYTFGSIALNGALGVTTTGLLNSGSLTANSTNGSVSVSQTTATSISGSGSTGINITDVNNTGTAGAPVNVNVSTATSGSGDVNITTSNAFTNLTTSGAISGQNVFLQSTNGSITLGGSVSASAASPNGTIALISAGSLTDNGTGNSGLSNLGSANNLVLQSTAGNINLTGSYSFPGSISLSATTGGTGSISAGVLSTNNLILAAGSGGINVSAAGAPEITANSTGNVQISNTVALTSNGVSSGANFSLTDSANVVGAMTITNPITATGNLTLATTGTVAGTSISINSPISANGTVNLNVNGTDGAGSAFAITEAGTGSITGTALAIDSTATTGTVTANLTNASNNVGSLSAAVGSGAANNINLNDSGNTNTFFIGALNGVNNFSLTNGGDIANTASSTFTGTLSLNSAGSINLPNALTANTAMILTATTSAAGSVTAANLTTPNLSASAGTGGISITATSAGTLAANSTGSVTITNDTAGAVNLGASSAGNGDPFSLTVGAGKLNINGNLQSATGSISNVTLSSSGTLTNTGGTISGDVVQLTSTAGNVSLTNGVTGNTSITLQATGAGGGITATGALSTPNLTLSSDTGGISVSSTNAGTLAANSTGSVTITNDSAGTVNLVASSAGNGDPFSLTVGSGTLNISGNLQSATGSLSNVTLSSAGNLTNTAGTITGDVVQLSSTAANVNLTNGVTGNTSITLQATGAGGGITTTGALSTPNLTLSSDTGGISVSSTNAGTLSANSTGSVTITNDTAAAVNLGASSAGNGDPFSLTVGSGTLNVNGNLQSATGSISNVTLSSSGTLTNTGGTITGDVVQLTSTAGNVSLTNGVTGNTSTTLQATGTGGGITATGALSTPSLTLSSDTGGISVSSTNAGTLTANSTGSVTITNDSAGTVNLEASSAGNGDPFSLTVGSGTLNISGNLQSATGSLSNVTLSSAGNLTNTAGTITGDVVQLSSTATNVNLTNGVTGNTSITLQATGAGGGITTTGALSAPNLTLSSGTGGISVSSTNAGTLAANSTGSVTITNDTAGAVSLSASSAGNGKSFSLTVGSGTLNVNGNLQATTGNISNVTLSSSGTLTNTGGTVAGDVVQLSSTAGNVNLTNNVTGNTSIALQATGSGGGITTTGALSTPSLTLSSDTGGISVSSTSAGTLAANSTGSVTITNDTAGAVNLGASSAGNGDPFSLTVGSGTLNVTGDLQATAGSISNVTLSSSGTLTNTGGTVTGDIVQLSSTAGNVNLTNGVTGNTSITVQATGAGGGITATGALSTPDLTLSSGTGGISVSSTSAGTLTASSTGSVTITNDTAGAVSLSASSAGNGKSFSLTVGSGTLNVNGNLQSATGSISNVTLSSSGTLTNTGGTVAGDVVQLSSTAGNVNLTNNVTGNTSIALQATGSGGGITTTGALSTPSLTLSSDTGGISVSSTSAGTLAANSTGSVTITNDTDGAVNLGASSAGNGDPFSLTVGSGTLNVTGDLQATAGSISNVTLSSSGTLTNTTGSIIGDVVQLSSTTGNVSLTKNVTGNTSVTLQAIGSGGGISSTGTLSTPNLTLSSDTGGISVSSTNAGTLTASSTGSVTITNDTAGTVNLEASSAGNGAPFSLTVGSGTLNVNGNLQATTGSLSNVTLSSAGNLTNTGGTITGDVVQISSTGGNVNLTNNVTGNTSITLNGNSAGAGVSSTSTLSGGSLIVNSNTGGSSIATTNMNSIDDTSTGAIVFNQPITTTGGGSVTLHATTSVQTPDITTSGGDIALTAGTSITVGNLNSSSTTGAGGAITLDSSTSSFNLSSVNTSSTVANAGSLSFKQSGANLTNAPVAFTTGAVIDLSGNTVTASTPSINITLANGNGLGDVSTNNNGTGAAGSITLTGTTALSFTAPITAQSPNGTDGNVNLTSPTGISTSTPIGGAKVTLTAQNGDVDINNGGNVHASGTLTITAPSTNAITVAAGGSLNGATISLTAGASTNNGSITAGAGGVTFNMTSGSLTNNGSITAGAGGIQFSQAGAGLTVAGTGTLFTTGSISASSATGPVSIVQGVITGALDGTSVGGYSVQTTNGTLDADNSNVKTQGGDLSFLSSQDISVANGTLTTGGGNVILSAAGTIAGNNATITANSASSNQQVTIGTGTFSFTGGAIGIFADGGTTPANADTQLLGFTQSRVFQGTLNGLQASNVTATGIVITDNNQTDSGFIKLDSTGGTISLVSATINNQGGVIFLDPGLTFNGATFNASQPSLPSPAPLPTLPPAPSTPPALPLPLSTAGTISIATTSTTRVTDPANNVVTSVDQNPETRVVNSNFVFTGTIGCVPQFMDVAAASQTPDASWYMVSGSCESFTFHNEDGLLIVGSKGTMLSPLSNGIVELHGGRMLATTGAKPLQIQTSHGIVKLEPGSSAIIDQKSTGVTQVDVLVGAPASVQVNSKDEHKLITANAGEEVVTASGDIDDEEMIPVDGVDRSLEASLVVADTKATKSSVSVSQLLEKDNLVNCVFGCLPNAVRARLEKVKDKSGSHVAQAPVPAMAYKLVNQPMEVESNETSKLKIPTGSIRFSSNAQFLSEPAVLKLSNGQVLVAAQKPMIVETKQSSIHLNAGDTAVVSCNAHSTSVTPLWQKQVSSITIQVGKETLRSPEGDEVVVCDSQTSLAEMQKKDPLARRLVRIRNLAEGPAIMTSEVSCLSLIRQTPVLMTLFKSKEPADIAMRQKMEKMAVVLSIVTDSHGNYAPPATP